MLIKRFSILIGISTLFFTLAWLALAQPAHQKQPERGLLVPASSDHNPFFPPYLLNRQRMGYNKTSNHDATVLNAGWYTDWGANANPPQLGLDYARVIYLPTNGVPRCQAADEHSEVTPTYTGTALINNVLSNPGQLWIIGNEPDSFYNGSPIYPELYAELYHYFYHTIKSTDPTAKVGVASVVQASPLRLEYLDNVLNHYQTTFSETLQSDVWSTHLYRFNEGACGSSWGAAVPPGSSSNQGWNVSFSAAALLNVPALEQSIRDFRQWMYDRGHGNKPFIITEYGILPPPSYSGFGNAVAAQFLDDTFTMFLTATDPTTGYPEDANRLVQMWAWFSTDHNPPAGYFKYGGDLFNSDNSLTIIGDAFVGQSNAFDISNLRLDNIEKDSIGISSRYIITNTGNIATTAIHQFYTSPMTGSLILPIYTATSIIPPGTGQFYDLLTVTDLPDGYAGYVIISADQPLSGTIVGQSVSTPTPTPTWAGPTATTIVTATITPTVTVTTTPTITPTPSVTVTFTPTPTATDIISTPTPSPTPTITPTGPTPTPTPIGPFNLILQNLEKQLDGPSSRYMVTNSGSSPAQIEQHFYTIVNGGATLIHIANDSIAAGASHIYQLSDMPALPDAYSGYVIIYANQPIIGTILSPSTPTPTPSGPTPTLTLTPTPLPTAIGPTPTPTTTPQPSYNIILNDLHKESSGVSSRYIITNTGTISTNSTHAFYQQSLSNTMLVHTEFSSLAAQDNQLYDLANLNGVPDGFEGYVVINANQLLVGRVLNPALIVEDLAIYQYIAKPAEAGKPVEYVLVYQNQGNGVVNNIHITDTLPLSTSYLSSYAHQASTHVNQNNIAWHIPSLNAYQAGYISIRAQVDEAVLPDSLLFNQAQISGEHFDENLANNTATLSTTLSPPSGHIMGRVQGPNGDFLPHVDIYALDALAQVKGWGDTDEMGYYKIENLKDASYHLYFQDEANTYPGEYYQDATTIDNALPLTITAGETIRNINVLLDEAPPFLSEVRATTGLVIPNAATDTFEVRMSTYNLGNVAITATVTCSNSLLLDNLPLTYIDTGQMLFVFPMAQIANTQDYTVVINSDRVEAGQFGLLFSCSGNTVMQALGHINLYTPIGQVTDLLTGQPLANVKIDLFNIPNWQPKSSIRDTNPSSCHTMLSKSPDKTWASLPPAPTALGVPAYPEPSTLAFTPPLNPTFSDSQGYYHWDLSQGCWYIIAQAEGYQSVVSPLFGGPPATTGLNLALLPSSQGQLVYLPLILK